MAILLRAGFIVPSSVPTGQLKEFRDLTRMRVRVVKDKTRVKNGFHNFLDSMLVKLGLSDASECGANQTLLRALTGDYYGLTTDQRRALRMLSDTQGIMVINLVSEVYHLRRFFTC